jgi:hypothetical protein
MMTKVFGSLFALILLSGCIQSDPMSELIRMSRNAGLNCITNDFCTDLGTENGSLADGGRISFDRIEKEFVYSVALKGQDFDFLSVIVQLDTGRSFIRRNDKLVLSYDYIGYRVISGDEDYIPVFWDSVSILEFMMDYYDVNYNLNSIYEYYN